MTAFWWTTARNLSVTHWLDPLLTDVCFEDHMIRMSESSGLVVDMVHLVQSSVLTCGSTTEHLQVVRLFSGLTYLCVPITMWPAKTPVSLGWSPPWRLLSLTDRRLCPVCEAISVSTDFPEQSNNGVKSLLSLPLCWNASVFSTFTFWLYLSSTLLNFKTNSGPEHQICRTYYFFIAFNNSCLTCGTWIEEKLWVLIFFFFYM